MRAFFDWADREGVDPLTAALGHARSLPWADQVVVGVTSAAELEAIVRAWQDPAEPAPIYLACDDLALIDPRGWRQETSL